MNWNATEANWRLAMDPRAAEDCVVVEAAAFVAESRTVRPGTWANGIYVGKDFMTVCMFAREQQDAAFAAQSENGTVNADVPASPPPPVYPTTPANGPDLGSLAGDHLAHLCAEEEADDLEINEQDRAWRGDAPPGAPPAYRSAEAQRQAEEEPDEELQRERPRQKRNRYVDDESKVGSEDDGDDKFNVFSNYFLPGGATKQGEQQHGQRGVQRGEARFKKRR